jgi:hypothetical protein
MNENKDLGNYSLAIKAIMAIKKKSQQIKQIKKIHS